MSARCTVTAGPFVRHLSWSTRPLSREATNVTGSPRFFKTLQHGHGVSCHTFRQAATTRPTNSLTRRCLSTHENLNEVLQRHTNKKKKFDDASRTGMFIPDELLEHYPETTQPPTRRERERACHFFETHKPVPVFTATELHQVTVTGVPEVAVIGRSNVGKSQLINRLLGFQVAQTGVKPGKTSKLSGWGTGAPDRSAGKPYRLTVVDMPGYGKGSRHEWGVTIQEYLTKRRELRRVFVLININHTVMDSDRQLLGMLRQAAIPHQIVMTKADKLLMPNQKASLTARAEKILYSFEYLDVKRGQIGKKVEEVREASKGEPGQISAMEEVVICSSESSGIVGQQPERQKTIGINGFRCAVLRAIGYR